MALNISEIEKQILPYLIKLAKSPPVQAEIEAAKVAIITILRNKLDKAIPYGLRTISRILRWIYKKFKGECVKMATTTITVQNTEGTTLSGVTISYAVNGITVEGTTDTNGKLVIESLPAGTYTFATALNGYTSASKDMTITDIDAAAIITLTAETTVTKTSIADVVKDAAENAAKESLSESLTSESSNLITYLTNLADERIAMWEADSKRTSDNFVKFRNALWIADLKAAKALVKTAGTVGIALLVQKLSK
ncbi:SpaA isopeptide-forming pilin-related protein [Sporomusa acidovorans]|uniref:SpaA-like prealbumin fold domain-containing protein n=1 Tax=Sporomusa acidovorans (strain ATCC 49682 / DSM 3132 / Mol) TaxID=1123286 RepID=A0ABZ3J876_SPOA4|nr:carboxypeptidase-like regulatory domain-containing protein [Sporomusa acidovorans]OZC15994.1 hypothetical protein SPACI_43600 [Sporomusa acidovorans DSM 3132]SDD90482.1 hypothetical protein SAMN04488499_1005137 [Sporomusa acidovorans]